MQIDAELLDEVVVVGYGTTTKRKTTSAVATVNAEALAAIPAQSISDWIARTCKWCNYDCIVGSAG